MEKRVCARQRGIAQRGGSLLQLTEYDFAYVESRLQNGVGHCWERTRVTAELRGYLDLREKDLGLAWFCHPLGR